MIDDAPVADGREEMIALGTRVVGVQRFSDERTTHCPGRFDLHRPKPAGLGGGWLC